MHQPKDRTHRASLACLILLAVLVAISMAMILLAAWQRDITITNLTERCGHGTKTPTANLLPWAVCHVRRKVRYIFSRISFFLLHIIDSRIPAHEH